MEELKESNWLDRTLDKSISKESPLLLSEGTIKEVFRGSLEELYKLDSIFDLFSTDTNLEVT